MTTFATSDQETFVPPSDFVLRLTELAATRPDDVALIVVAERDGELVETVLCYREFGQRVRALAAVLQQRLARGDRALILLDNDEHYAVSMFACFHAGVIAVPVFPPESTHQQHLARLAAIAADSRAQGILTISSLSALVDAAAREFGVPAVVAVDEVDPLAAADWHRHEPALSDVAFLQYTSGSTSAPKGVMVTHGNLMANERAIREGLGIGPQDKFGVWSPLFHDMGLIGGLLQPFYSGIPCVLASPRYFLERPVRWLQMISRHRVTISGGPDFAYRLCVDRVKDGQLAGLDLSSWRVAYTGAEPVRHDTMDAFIVRHAAVGFDAAAIYPCYGLAEATLFVTGGRRGGGMVVSRFDAEGLAGRQVTGASAGTELVGCGYAPSGHEVRIVDPDTGGLVGRQTIGEIWAAGPSIAAGYWNKPAETANAFVERDGRRWLRTGDLGFVHDGQLFVAGRLKDMIIVRGHNLYPQDIERAIEAEVDAVRKGRVAAFAVDVAGREGIGIAAEVSRSTQKRLPPAALIETLSAAIGALCGEAPSVVVLLNPGGLPKTSSAKLQRGACRSGWVQNTLDAYAVQQGPFVPEVVVTAPMDEIGTTLAALWREVLLLDDEASLGGSVHFFALGGNSLKAVQLATRIAERWSVAFSARTVFERPRLADMAQAVRDGLATADESARARIPQLPAAQRHEALPLSPAQARQWVLWRLDPASTAYHVGGAQRLSGRLDTGALAAAVADLAARHEALRTTFEVGSDGQVRQRVLPGAAVALAVHALRGAEPDVLEIPTTEWVRQVHAEPFDPALGPPWRIALAHLASGEHLLALVLHHIVCDGESMKVLLDELTHRYAAHVAGEAGDPARALPALPVQYPDYAVWQHTWLQAADESRTDNPARQLAYWRQQLDTDHPVLMLPTDRPRPARAVYRAARHAFELPADLLADVRHTAQSQDATLFMVMLAAFQALLYRHTGQHDVRVGVPVANRGRREIEGVVGLFVNTVVVCGHVTARLPLTRLLVELRAVLLAAQAHADLPFDHVVDALQVDRSLSHAPLFQVMFNHLHGPLLALAQVPGLTVAEHPLPEGAAQFELAVDLLERPDGSVGVAFVYAAELFEAETIARMAGHYQALLQALVTDAAQAVGDVVCMGLAEQAAWQSWAGLREQPRATGLSPSAGVHQRIAEQAARRPDALALTGDGVSWTFDRLQRQSNRWAHHLIRLGVRRHTPVAVMLPRSPELVVALLAVFKAGGVYVPIDAAQPVARRRQVLEDSRAALLLGHGEASSEWGVPVWQVDEATSLDLPEHDPAVPLHAEQLAYVIYTSGSTGQPKGVAVSHGALARHVHAMADACGFTPADRALLFAAPHVDAALEQTLVPLASGAALVLQVQWSSLAGELDALLSRHHVSVVDLPPAYVRPLLQGQPPFRHGVRLALFGGEAWTGGDLALIRQVLHPQRVVNAYGPTEAVITPTLWQGDAQAAIDGPVPIGRPLGPRLAVVLDSDLQPVPVGVPGELYLGGPLLAQAYAGRAALTAERFIANPFDANGGRLYRTGDRVAWRADGQLVYLARLDQQVKLRGFRIELGEIEAALRAQTGVREAAVLLRDDGPAGPALVAYVAADGDDVEEGRPDAAQLKAELAQRLPDYMVPAAVVLLDRLPLQAGGKLDHRALPAPAWEARTASAPPQGPVAKALAAIWCEVLQVAAIGLHDNFFDLGGNSLLLIRVHQLIDTRLHAGLSVVDLFASPTLDALARRIGAVDAARAAPADEAQARALRQRAALQRRRPTERIE